MAYHDEWHWDEGENDQGLPHWEKYDDVFGEYEPDFHGESKHYEHGFNSRSDAEMFFRDLTEFGPGQSRSADWLEHAIFNVEIRYANGEYYVLYDLNEPDAEDYANF